jgi:hypothetical protein
VPAILCACLSTSGNRRTREHGELLHFVLGSDCRHSPVYIFGGGIFRLICKAVLVGIDNQLKTISQRELTKDGSQVMTNSYIADCQVACNLSIFVTAADESDYVALSLNSNKKDTRFHKFIPLRRPANDVKRDYLRRVDVTLSISSCDVSKCDRERGTTRPKPFKRISQ